MNELERLLYHELYRKSFYDFYRDFWKYADPHPYIDGEIPQFFCEVFQFMCRSWVGYHIPETECEVPEPSDSVDVIDIRHSKKDRLCLNMPPRHSKSMIFNVMGPTWLWTYYPIKAVSISHTGELAQKMNQGRYSVVNSERYKEIFPEIETPENKKNSIIDKRGGQLYSQNRDALTGYGGDIIVNDDLTNAMTAYKDMTEMANAWEYYQNTMPSRINDVTHSVIFNIQQRLGINDITGHIMKVKSLRDRYIFISLPAIFKKETYIVCPISGRVLHYSKGEGLWPERFGDYEGIKAEVGESIFRTQYEQDPMSTDRAIITEDMIQVKNQTEVPTIEKAEIVFASHDFPVKDKDTSDFLGSVLGYKVEGTLYIKDCLEKHMNFPASVRYVEALDTMYPGIIQVIEDKANGSPILQQLQGKIAGLQAYNPGTKSKAMRLDSASMYMGSVVFIADEFDVLSQEWMLSDNLQNLINRLYEFPMVEHDDIVDAFDMLVNFVFLDKKYSVYGKSFSDKNVIDVGTENDTDLKKLYGGTFVNKEGDTWKMCKIKIKYGYESKLLVTEEREFRGSAEDGIAALKEFSPDESVYIDCSENQELSGRYADKLTFVGYTIDDFDKSVLDLNLAFSKQAVLIDRKCRMTKADIEMFKYSKTKNEEAKYVTEKDGFVACLRIAMIYFGGII